MSVLTEIATETVVEDSDWRAMSDVMNAFIRTEILTAACQLGLFDYLATAQFATEEDLATRFDLDTQGMRILLMGCKQAGLVDEPERGTYVNACLSRRFLTVGSPQSILKFISFVRAVQQKSCHTLLETLKRKTAVGLIESGARSGQTLYEFNSGLSGAETEFHAAMSEYSRIVAPPLLPELARRQHLFDIGGGIGDVANRLCVQHPHLVCTILEMPTVCARVNARIAARELSQQIRTVGIDILNEEWPPDADAILFSHFVEIFDPIVVQKLYSRVSSYLPVGGQVMIWTLTAPIEGDISLQAVKSSVYFLTAAGGNGMTYSPEEHVSWLQAAGLNVDRVEAHISTSHTLIIATKRVAENRQ